MTEEEWLACDDPWSMLRFHRDRAKERRARLFAVACCRAVYNWLPDSRSREAVEVAERLADGLAGTRELRRAERRAFQATGEVGGHLRAPGPQVRGCHVVDAVLGRG
jgi:hypothetical protein